MNDSPVKKIDFDAANKENAPTTTSSVESGKPGAVKPAVEEVKTTPSVKDSEADEPLLQENPNRFVLFPIKYHEVRCSQPPDASRVKCFTYGLTRLLVRVDLANVQEGGGFVLDCGRDRPVQGSPRLEQTDRR